MPKKLDPTEARQATMRPRSMLLVLLASLLLCLIAGIALALGWISLPALSQYVRQQGERARSHC